jgi:hypothetical protein
VKTAAPMQIQTIGSDSGSHATSATSRPAPVMTRMYGSVLRERVTGP